MYDLLVESIEIRIPLALTFLMLYSHSLQCIGLGKSLLFSSLVFLIRVFLQLKTLWSILFVGSLTRLYCKFWLHFGEHITEFNCTNRFIIEVVNLTIQLLSCLSREPLSSLLMSTSDSLFFFACRNWRTLCLNTIVLRRFCRRKFIDGIDHEHNVAAAVDAKDKNRLKIAGLASDLLQQLL